MKYFASITTLEELKREYKKLAMANHPDRGGNEEVMKEINNQYETAFNAIKDGHNATNEKKITECPEEFKDVLDRIINLFGIEIEICGSWIWVSGNTKTHKETLKELKFTWAKKKEDFSLWFWRSEENKSFNRGKKSTMDEIRMKHGSEKIKTGFRPVLV